MGQSGNFLNLELFSAIKMLFLMAQGNCEHKYYPVLAIRVLWGTVPPSSRPMYLFCHLEIVSKHNFLSHEVRPHKGSIIKYGV